MTDSPEVSAVRVAGGIGITPLLAMAQTLQERGTDYVLHVCARSKAAMPFADMLEAPECSLKVRAHLDDGDASQKFAVHELPLWRDGMLLYVCGPRPFMTWVMKLATSRGWPDTALRSESFAPPDHDQSANRPFSAVLRKSRREVAVPANKTLLQVLQDEGYPAVASCTRGLCGACRVDVIEGDVEHRDQFFSEDERSRCGQMTPCVSRAAGTRLVLDM